MSAESNRSSGGLVDGNPCACVVLGLRPDRRDERQRQQACATCGAVRCAELLCAMSDCLCPSPRLCQSVSAAIDVLEPSRTMCPEGCGEEEEEQWGAGGGALGGRGGGAVQSGG
eukprot:44530-Rhodomonas_salina.1